VEKCCVRRGDLEGGIRNEKGKNPVGVKQKRFCIGKTRLGENHRKKAIRLVGGVLGRSVDPKRERRRLPEEGSGVITWSTIQEPLKAEEKSIPGRTISGKEGITPQRDRKKLPTRRNARNDFHVLEGGGEISREKRLS